MVLVYLLILLCDCQRILRASFLRFLELKTTLVIDEMMMKVSND